MQLKFYFRKKYYISYVSIKLGQKKKKIRSNRNIRNSFGWVKRNCKFRNRCILFGNGVSGSRDYELNINEHFMDSDRVIVKSN